MNAPIDFEDATLVHIAVKGERPPYVLGVFPQRTGDTTVFANRKKDAPKHCAERPREVVWVGHDIPDGMYIRISAKVPVADPKLSGPMPGNEYRLIKSDHMVRSGRVMLNDEHAAGALWAYNVELLSDKTNEPAADAIDPDVIIKPDP